MLKSNFFKIKFINYSDFKIFNKCFVKDFYSVNRIFMHVIEETNSLSILTL